MKVAFEHAQEQRHFQSHPFETVLHILPSKNRPKIMLTVFILGLCVPSHPIANVAILAKPLGQMRFWHQIFFCMGIWHNFGI